MDRLCVNEQWQWANSIQKGTYYVCGAHYNQNKHSHMSKSITYDDACVKWKQLPGWLSVRYGLDWRRRYFNTHVHRQVHSLIIISSHRWAIHFIYMYNKHIRTLTFTHTQKAHIFANVHSRISHNVGTAFANLCGELKYRKITQCNEYFFLIANRFWQSHH